MKVSTPATPQAAAAGQRDLSVKLTEPAWSPQLLARIEPPRSGGSHYKVAHPKMVEKLTIPYKRRIKPVYVRKLVAFIDAVRKQQ